MHCFCSLYRGERGESEGWSDNMTSINMIDEIEIKNVPKKSTEESIKTRNEGNKLYGSSNHNKQVHLDILSLYNESAAKAENDSEELALAISNRSVLLMHLKMYKESIDDIEKSLQITKSEELKSKLLTRKIKCLSLIDQSEEDKNLNDAEISKVPIIENVSKIIPCAADCVSIAYNEKYGRHIVATEDIEPGTIISIEKAFALVPKRDKTYTNCSRCLMLACNGIPCNSCSALIYCSEKCRDEAWIEYHDVECLILPYLRCLDIHYENLTIMIIAVRLFIKFLKKEGLRNILIGINKIKMDKAEDEFLNSFFDNGIFQNDKFQSFYNLLKDVNHTFFKNDILYHYTITKRILNYLAENTDIFKNYDVILNDYDETSFNFIIQILYKLNLIVGLNASNFGESVCYCKNPESCGFNCGDQTIGVFITPFSSLINHSCDENICKLFTKKQEMVLITAQSIKKGDQIFTNYGTPLNMSKNCRQNILMEDYNFACNCDPCKNDLPTDLSTLYNNSDVVDLTTTFLNSGINEKSLEAFHGTLHNASFDDTTIKDVIKMCQIIEKNCDSTLACAYLYSIKDYIIFYFDKMYNVKIFNIPDSC